MEKVAESRCPSKANYDPSVMSPFIKAWHDWEVASDDEDGGVGEKTTVCAECTAVCHHTDGWVQCTGSLCCRVCGIERSFECDDSDASDDSDTELFISFMRALSEMKPEPPASRAASPRKVQLPSAKKRSAAASSGKVQRAPAKKRKVAAASSDANLEDPSVLFIS